VILLWRLTSNPHSWRHRSAAKQKRRKRVTRRKEDRLQFAAPTVRAQWPGVTKTEVERPTASSRGRETGLIGPKTELFIIIIIIINHLYAKYFKLHLKETMFLGYIRLQPLYRCNLRYTKCYCPCWMSYTFTSVLWNFSVT